jgi:hypothetical protein
MSRAQLRKQGCVTVPIQRLRCHRDRTRNGPSAGLEAAAQRALTFRATGILGPIRMRNGGGLAVCRHNGGNPCKGDYRALQADGEHHDQSDERALHV